MLHLVRVVSIAALSARGIAAPRAVFIVAGQSNMLNWHAAAAALPTDARDAQIPFFYETGAPTRKALAVTINSSSHEQWTTLGPQRQEPFIRYERDFFGPEITLARRLAVIVMGVAIIKVGYFGTNLARDWNPETRRNNDPYPRLQHIVKTAFTQLREHGDEPVLRGFFWMQGETDGLSSATAAAYGSNLAGFIARVRADLGTPKLPFVLGRVGPPPPRSYVYQGAVRDAQVHIATSTPGVAWVDTDDLPRGADGIHLQAPGVVTLGMRMADAWTSLVKSPSRQ